MEYEQLTLEGFEQRTAALEQSLSEMEKRLAAVEQRLGRQETKTRKANQYRQLQAEQIEQLTEIVKDLAAETPLRAGTETAAISKEEAYRRFMEYGIGKVTAMRALRKAGAIKARYADRNTDTIWLNGKCQRVIIVVTKE